MIRAFKTGLACCLLPFAFCTLLFAFPDGPGLPKRHYPAREVFQVISSITPADGAPRAHGNASMHKGYLVIVFSEDGEPANGGFAFYDISDPYNPKLVARREDAETHEIREAHGYGYSSSYGADLVALQAAYGVQIWDWSDVKNPVRLSYLHLPGIEDSNYALGAWWLFWQAPYIYVGGSGNGIYVVKASDPRHPVLVARPGGRPNPIPISQTGGFRVGPIFAVGNLLVVSSMEDPGYATFDISDPENPALLMAETQNMPPVYSMIVNGDKILGVDIYNNFTAFDLSTPDRLRYVNGVSIGGRGGYLTFQDGYAHAGASVQYVKIDMRDRSNYEVVGTASSGIPDRDEDFAAVLGNLVVISDDHGNGSTIVPHQAEPDTLGPSVNMVIPHEDEVNQALTTRIGVSCTDAIDLRSVQSSSFIVRPYGGAALPGKYSGQTGVLSFSPDAPLQPNTLYEIVLPKGGIRDVSGNATPSTFTSVFSTGAVITLPLVCAIQPHEPVVAGTEVTFQAESSGGNGAVAYAWDFGDGSPATPFLPSAEAKHIYARPGHFTVRLNVTDGQSRASAALAQTVHLPLTSLSPTSASNIIFDPQQNLVWNVNPDNGSVTATEASTLTKRFEASVGDAPRTLAQAPEGSIWVVNEKSASLSVLANASGNLLETIKLPPGSRPFSVVFTPSLSDSSRATTSLPTGTGSLQNSMARRVRKRDSQEPEPPAEVFAYVTLQATGKLLQLDPATRRVIAELEVGPSPRGLAISAAGTRIFVTRFISPADHGEITEIAAPSFAIVRRFALALDPGPDTEASGRGVPNYVQGLTLTPDGGRAWIPSKKDNTVRGLQHDGLRLTFESTVRTIVSQIDLQKNTEALPARLDLNDRDMAIAVRFSPLGDYAFVAAQGSNKIDIFDVYSLDLIASIENAGRAPIGMAFNPEATRLFVNAFMSRSLLVYEVSGIMRGLNNDAQLLAEVSTVAQEKLPPLVLEGKRIFYNANDRHMNRDGYLSCASCHLEGEEDGRVWDFTDRGEGLRNTITLVGRRGTGQGRVHWSGNFDEIQDFENDMRSAFDGSGFMSDADFYSGTRSQPLGDRKAGFSPALDALAAYVESLDHVPDSPYRTASGELTTSAAAGKIVFQQLHCAVCHGGQEFTDSPLGLRHDVGTITFSSGQRLHQPLLGIDTPTLRGLWATPPYLHDGSAATVLEVLTSANASNIHGKTLDLNEQQRQQLADYLLQIDAREPAAPTYAPALVLTMPRPRQTFPKYTLIHFSVEVAGTADSLIAVEYFADAEKIGAAAAAPFHFAWKANRPGQYLVTARALFGSGIKTLSAPVGVFVSSKSTLELHDATRSDAPDDSSLPEDFLLSAAHPNPFNAAVRVQVDLPEAGHVNAVIYGIDGREIIRLLDADFSAGRHALTWQGQDAAHAPAHSGVYFMRVRFASASGTQAEATQRLLLLK